MLTTTIKRTVLGIEIGPREVRMVEMRGGASPRILKASAVPLPANALDGDRIVQLDAVADIIRGLHTRLGCQTRAAVVGMGVQSVVTRVLDIPRVPDSELRIVLEGELAHYQILRAGTGAFDYFRLDNTGVNEEALPSVLLMAAEDRVAQGYRIVVERAGLQMLALEPVTLALYRSAYATIQEEPAALCLAVTPQRSELSIVDHGQIRLYRRLETGSNDFIRGRKSQAASAPVDLTSLEESAPTAGLARTPTLLNIEEDERSGTDELSSGSGTGGLRGRTGTAELPEGDGATSKIIPQVAGSFASEVQRSLDYYRREFPNATAVRRVLLASNDPDVSDLTVWLQQALQTDVSLIEPPFDLASARQGTGTLEATNNLQYMGAVGLALHALTPDWRQVPHFNLSAANQATAIPVERDRLTAVMVAALCVLIGGAFFGTMIARNANTESDRLTQLRSSLNVYQQDFEAMARSIQSEKNLSAIVKSDNLPVPAIIDLLTNQAPAGIGLTNLNIQRDGSIVVEGNARDLQDFNLYYLNVMVCPHFVQTRYDSLSTDQTTRITKFKIQTALKGTHAALSSRRGSF